MSSFFSQNEVSSDAVLNGYLTVQDAANYSGYNVQYLRRLVQTGIISGRKVGIAWLVKLASLDIYLRDVRQTNDRRYGPRVYHHYIGEQQE